MKYYVIAGERSGDLHAGNLVKELRKKDVSAEVRGMGGESMRNAGVDLLLHYKETSFMGFAEVLMNIRKISKVTAAVKKDLLLFNPDVLILVDFAGFNLRIAKFAKENNIKVFYYISPKVWAWNQSRAYKIKKLVDHMFVIMPFEKEFYAQFGFNKVDYIGNPLLDSIKSFKPDPDFKAKFPEDKPLIAVLAGSRKQEVLAMSKKVAQIARLHKNFQFVVATVDNLDTSVYQSFETEPNVSLVHNQTYDLLSNADAGIITSGTATLETALFKLPQVVVYQASAITYQIVKRLIKVPYISLVNLIAGKEIVKELIQHDFSADKVSEELMKIIPGGKNREEMLKDYEKLHAIMGEVGASERAAGLIFSKIETDKSSYASL